ncbi:MAG: SDR family NAD(P)-dependent oxidoreductase, partial [Planctomycetes bacterium]|nr:SDR family NAD(P)-dependent oxidoreductase [Planctomycetota bacterium]
PYSSKSSTPIASNDVVVVTGGARGVTAEVAKAMAKIWKPRLVLLGRSPEPTVEPDWLRHLTTDIQIKQALIARAPSGTVPRMIDAQLAQIKAEREVSTTLNQLKQLGIDLVYRSVDVRNAEALKALLDQIQWQIGPVRGIVHGAGVLADGHIESKTKDQFDRVFETKVTGLKNLLASIQPDQLKFLGVFSSYTARFGRVGQCDYAIANEVLNKLSRQFAFKNPQTHVASFNWGPWDGGMVTGGLKSLFTKEGVGLIPLSEGADLLVREFSQQTSRPVEVLVIQQDQQGKRSEQTALENTSYQSQTMISTSPDRSSSNSIPFANSQSRIEQEADSSEARSTVERMLDVSRHPFLESHVIGGKAVLPVAMMVEWMAHAVFHRNPGLELCGIDDLRVFQGVRVDRESPIDLRLHSMKPTRVDGQFHVKVQLSSVANGRDVTHAAGMAVLAASFNDPPAARLTVSHHPYSMNVSSAYSSRLFHGPQFHGILDIESCNDVGIVV